MNIGIILGTRPEIIKLSPVIRECERRELDYFILHTGQHYSSNMDRVFFDQLELPDAHYNLDVGSGSHGEQTGGMLTGIEKILVKEQPDVVLVEGDTNTVLAGSLAAAKLHIDVGHVEAGLRSYDRTMPEEVNRVLADHCSDYLFAPTTKARDILRGEGIPEDAIYVTGNTVVDAVYQNMEIGKEKVNPMDEYGLHSKEYFLATAHRSENVDVKTRFAGILEGLKRVGEKFDAPVVYPIHPRSKQMMQQFELHAEGIQLVDPVDYLSFLQLEANARMTFTDSGGVQEETCILGVPCVTLRDNTERPETIDVGSNILAGTDPSAIVDAASQMIDKRHEWNHPFGDGNAGKRIIDIISTERC